MDHKFEMNRDPFTWPALYVDAERGRPLAFIEGWKLALALTFCFLSFGYLGPGR